MSLIDAVNGSKAEPSTQPETFIHPSQRKTYDKNVTLEEYRHYAKITRAQEEEDFKKGAASPSFLQSVLGRGKTIAPEHRNSVSPGPASSVSPPLSIEKEIGVGHDDSRRRSTRSGHAVITNDEWQNASRAMRTASWGAGFYLITTGESSLSSTSVLNS